MIGAVEYSAQFSGAYLCFVGGDFDLVHFFGYGSIILGYGLSTHLYPARIRGCIFGNFSNFAWFDSAVVSAYDFYTCEND